MINHFLAIALTLFFVIDAFGNIPSYLSILSKVPPRKRLMIQLRELVIALGIMIVFHYLGELVLQFLHISAATVKVAGGIVLFLIAIRLIFSDHDNEVWSVTEPFIVPIATPLIAGPSVLALIMIYAQDEAKDYTVIVAILLAWAVSSLIFLSAKPIHKLIGDKGSLAIQRLTGLIVAIIAVQLFLTGVVEIYHLQAPIGSAF